MANIQDYLKKYANISFGECPFNEMDSVFFTQLSYFDWDNIVPSNRRKIPMLEAISLLLEAIERDGLKNNALFIRGCLANLKLLKTSTRYQKCQFTYYQSSIDINKQFGALCIELDPRTIYVSFEGTDNSVSGWKEDFALSYEFPIDSQKDAINYLNKVVRWWHKKVYVGGHSKGGNLAMVAYMYAKKSVKRKVKVIYNLDGPGFRGNEFTSNEYKEMVPKLKMYVPEESIIGMLLNTPPIYKVIQTSARGIRQHDTNYWKCLESDLVEGKLSKTSQKWDQHIAGWLDHYNDEERRKMVYTFFEILEKSEVKTFDGIKSFEWKKVLEVVKKMSKLDDETKKLYLKALRSLLFSK